MVPLNNVHQQKNVQNVETRTRQKGTLGYISVTLSNNNRKKEEGVRFCLLPTCQFARFNE